jgi:precorrin-6Y C5,15-methyltransferase (decarboxylating)
MPKVNIIGIGPGGHLTLTKEAEAAIFRSCCLIGDKRVLAPFENFKKPTIYSSNSNEINVFLQYKADNEEVSILVSGDVGFYSLAKILLAKDEKNDIRLICGISSLQYFCSKLKLAWDDVVTVSLHGREADLMSNLITKVKQNNKVFVLTGGENTPTSICRTLCEYGLGSLQVHIGENLSYPEEQINSGLACDIAQRDFAKLNVLMIVNNQLTNRVTTPGIPDDFFIRGKVPMTKQEVRVVTIAKLQLCPTDIVYDIGAGTGAVAVEIAGQLANGKVYAIEKDLEAMELIAKNKQKFGVANLFLVSATAPVGLAELPRPDKVFIGGSSGNLKDILDLVFSRNPKLRVVINAVTLETLTETMNYFADRPEYQLEIVNLAVSKARNIGGYNLMTGQNPVYIITASYSKVSE